MNSIPNLIRSVGQHIPIVVLSLILTLLCILQSSCRSQTPPVKNNILTMFQPKSVTFQDRVYNYIESGEEHKKTMLFIHGLGSNAKAFQKIIPYLDDTFHCYALNLIERSSEISLKQFAIEIHTFIEANKLKNITLIGHSMGGQIATWYTSLYPEDVHQLILLAPAGIEAFTEKDIAWFDKYVSLEYYLNIPKERVAYNFSINFYGDILPEDAAFMYQDRLDIMNDPDHHPKYANFYVGCIKAMLAAPVLEIIPSIETKTIIFFGKNDNLIPNKFLHPSLTTSGILEKANALFSNSQLHLLEDSGHFVQWDQPRLIAETIINNN